MSEVHPLTQHISELQSQGYSLIHDFLNSEQLASVNELFDQLLGKNSGRNNFEGNQTERIYTLVARHKVFQDIVEDARILALCDEFLLPNYLLTASQAIVIGPNESPQPWHTDDAFYRIARPRPMVSLSTIVAVEDFTSDNGGTQIVPGSHLWGDEKLHDVYLGDNSNEGSTALEHLSSLSVTVEMPAGSCVIFAGTLLHRGGRNSGTGTRRALSNQYCEPWARTQENFFLGIPATEAAQMSATVQSLLGYSIHPPFMGQVTASHPNKALDADFVPPAFRK